MFNHVHLNLACLVMSTKHKKKAKDGGGDKFVSVPAVRMIFRGLSVSDK